MSGYSHMKDFRPMALLISSNFVVFITSVILLPPTYLFFIREARSELSSSNFCLKPSFEITGRKVSLVEILFWIPFSSSSSWKARAIPREQLISHLVVFSLKTIQSSADLLMMSWHVWIPRLFRVSSVILPIPGIFLTYIWAIKVLMIFTSESKKY